MGLSLSWTDPTRSNYLSPWANMAHPKRKGTAHERNLALYFWERGCAVLRGCSSGGGVRRRYVPDIVAICNGVVLVMEAKYRGKPAHIYLDEEKMRGLVEFARRSRGRAMVVVKYGKGPWRAMPVVEPRPITIGRNDYDQFMDLGTLLASIQNRPMDEFFSS